MRFFVYTSRMRLATVLLFCATCFASTYQAGKLISVDDLPPASVVTGGTTVQSTLSEYRLNVQLGDLVYVCSYTPTFVWAYKPNDLLANDAVQARIEGKHLYIKRPNGKELKTTIMRRMRAPAPTSGN